MPHVEDLPLDSPYVPELLAQLRTAPAMRVQRVNGYPHGQCYWNAMRHAEKTRGEAITGWAVTWMPGYFVQANHHAIWVSGDRKHLADVTANSVGGEGWTTFLPETAEAIIPIDLRYPVLVPNKYIVLSEHPDLRAMMDADRRHRESSIALSDLYRSHGSTWTPGLGWSLGMLVEAYPLMLAIHAATQDYASAAARLKTFPLPWSEE